MAHNIFNDRFYSHREIPWHRLGTVFEDAPNALEAWKRAPYVVELEELQTASGLSVPNRAIIRHPVNDDPETRVFGIVGPEYELITPGDVCQMWEDTVKKPIETMGALGKGEDFFISTKLGDSEIAGDLMQDYMLVHLPLWGNASAVMRITNVRVVCWNTLMASDRNASMQYNIRHTYGAKDRMARWMEILFESAKTMNKDMQELFGVFAKHKVKKEETEYVLQRTYPDPNRPRANVPPYKMAQKLERYESDRAWAQNRRDLAFELFSGAGTGMDTKAAAGTLFGLVNAVVEQEDYRGAVQDPSSVRNLQRQKSAVFGYRADYKKNAFQAAAEVVSAA